MSAVVVAVAGAYGVFLLYTAALADPGKRDVSPSRWSARRRSARDWLTQAGLNEVRPLEFVLVVGVFGVVGAAIGFVLFGGMLPAAVLGAFTATSPVAWYRGQRARRRAESQDAWPRMIEELRLLTGSLGRSVPQALFEVGRAAPAELRDGFAAAQREWLLSTDFERALNVLKAALADDTADVVAETLLVGHELGGSDLERRLRSLADDRILDLQHRKDARAHQAGVRLTKTRHLTALVSARCLHVRLARHPRRSAHNARYSSGWRGERPACSQWCEAAVRSDRLDSLLGRAPLVAGAPVLHRVGVLGSLIGFGEEGGRLCLDIVDVEVLLIGQRLGA